MMRPDEARPHHGPHGVRRAGADTAPSQEHQGGRLSAHSALEVRPWAGTAVAVAGLLVGYYLLPLDGRGWVIGVLLALAAPVALVPVAAHQVRHILVCERPLASTIRALVVVPTVLTLGFAAAYYAVEGHNPGQIEGLETKTDALYFSLTMLSTVGFGDVHAVGQIGRVLASLQMVVDIALFGFVLQAVRWAARQRESDATGRR
jgi:voltage-gated potassium channel